MAEPDNMVLVMLREIRQEIADARGEAREANAALNKRIDAMNLNGMKALKGFIGHRNMTERTVASFDDQMSRLELRVAALETASAR